MDKKILYPDDWAPYSCEGLDYASAEEGGTYWESLRAITTYDLSKNVEKYSKPVDKSIWERPPQIVNCGYSPQYNSIYILGAIAQGGIYNSDMKDEELYAKLGCIIGHEISHGFDPSGSQFDKNGDMVNWWTDEDRQAFDKREKKMIDYYNSIHPWEGQDLHGGIMTGEACADMAGVKVMLRMAAKKPGFDYDAFFRAYANIWLTKDSPESAYSRIEDAHPMPYLRVNATLQQFDEFFDCYDIKEGDGMWLAPEDRVAIW